MTSALSTFITRSIDLSVAYIPKALLAVATLFVGFWLVGKVTKFVNSTLLSQHVDPSLSTFLKSLVSIGLKVLIIITVAGMVGVEVTSFIAVIGALGLALGLSLQGSLGNLAGGIIILLLKPYEVGDHISAQGQKGTVDRIEIFSTVLRNAEGHTVYIPNGMVAGGVITNEGKA